MLSVWAWDDRRAPTGRTAVAVDIFVWAVEFDFSVDEDNQVQADGSNAVQFGFEAT